MYDDGSRPSVGAEVRKAGGNRGRNSEARRESSEVCIGERSAASQRRQIAGGRDAKAKGDDRV